MHKSKYKRIALAVCFAFLPFSAHSAGLGKLTVTSGLGEPLRAEIDLISTTPEELSSLTAAIAPQEAYSIQGIERTSIHNAIQIQVARKPDGAAALKLTTRLPVEDPFLDMLIQVDWATGRLLREYTVLLDPPGYQQDSQPTIVTTPAAPALSSPTATVKPLADPTANTNAVSTVESVDKEYTTKSGDTLNKIAKDMQIEGYSLDQMLVGIYRANPQAFDGKNMNRLKVGQIIKAPSNDDFAAVTPQEAASEIRVQTSDWNAYRNRLAGIVEESAPAAEEAGDQATSGKLKTATEDKAAPKDSGPKDVVKLSKSEAANAGADSTNAKALQDKLSALQEENIARQKSVNEANERVAMLEKQIADLQALVTIKDKTLAGLQQDAANMTEVPASNQAGESPVESEPSTVELETEVPQPAAKATAETPEPKPAAKEPTVKEPTAKKPVAALEPTPAPGLIDDLLNNSVLLGGAAAVLLLGGGWLFLRNRRKHNLDSFEQGILTAGGLKANTVFGNTSGGTVDTGDTSFLTDFSQSPSGMIDTHDVDPIAEAEVYMAYGRDSQAEEILNDAISKEPTRYELHLKLLEIFTARNDTSAFEAVAGELYSTLGSSDPVWIKVAEMGRKLESTNPLYDLSKAHVPATAIESVANATSVMSLPANLNKLDASDFDSAEVMTEASLDFSLGGDDVAADETAATDKDVKSEETENTLDFDLGFGTEGEKTDQTESEPSFMDQGLSMDDTVQLDTSEQQESKLDFEMDFGNSAEDSSQVSEPRLTEEKSVSATLEDTTQFAAPSFSETLPNIEMPDLNPGKDEVANKSEPGSLEIPDFNMATASGEGESSPEIAKEESSGLDFNFDLGDDANANESVANFDSNPDAETVKENVLEMDLSGISLDMNTPADADETEEITISHDESEDVNTKLDLVTAYMDMGDTEGARELLDEVLKEGGSRQRERAQELLDSLV